jgi:LmbE family N-acetylglucosaminyl deacetylase
MTECVLVVAAHPDDEVLGCGGTLARHAAAGDRVHFVFAADGVASRLHADDAAHEERLQAAARAATLLGAGSVDFLGFPDNRLDAVPLLDLVQKLEALIERIKPSIVYTHHAGDLNVDHRMTQAAVLTACRPLPGSTVREIYAFEVLSSTEWAVGETHPFVPNHFVDIGAHLHRKLEALDAYRVEMRLPPHSRSVEHVRVLAAHRGYTAGVDAAEAFMTLRVIR